MLSFLPMHVLVYDATDTATPHQAAKNKTDDVLLALRYNLAQRTLAIFVLFQTIEPHVISSARIGALDDHASIC